MTEVKEVTAHYIDVEAVEKERALCQNAIIAQYDNLKIDEKRLAVKLKDLRQDSAAAKDAVAKMRELMDKP